ncbi:transposable element Tcb2 transposase [Trichonephila clavipes]|nr:transposable element Tcb2 transposase [Trichonephila clavipes]
MMRVWKQWTDEHRTTRKTGSGRWRVTSALDDRHLLWMTVNDLTASLRQLAARRSTATGVLMLPSLIHRRLLQRGLRARVPLYESRFNLWDHDGRIRVRRYADERCFPECVIERHNGLTSGVMVWGAISRHVQFNLLRIEDQHVTLLPWPAYSLDMSPIEQVWDLVGRCLARDPRSAASKDELLLHKQATWNSLPQADIQYLFDSMPLHIAAPIAARGGYTKY